MHSERFTIEEEKPRGFSEKIIIKKLRTYKKSAKHNMELVTYKKSAKHNTELFTYYPQLRIVHCAL